MSKEVGGHAAPTKGEGQDRKGGEKGAPSQLSVLGAENGALRDENAALQRKLAKFDRTTRGEVTSGDEIQLKSDSFAAKSNLSLHITLMSNFEGSKIVLGLVDHSKNIVKASIAGAIHMDSKNVFNFLLKDRCVKGWKKTKEQSGLKYP
jgi:hypothetical protein